MNNRTKMGSVRMSILLSILMALSGMAAIALAGPDTSPPNQFKGNVTLNGADASPGIVINAYIDGDLRGSVVVESSGRYGDNLKYLDVTGNASDEGKNITFTVCGATAEQNATWYAYPEPAVRVDLIAVDDEAPEVMDATATPPSIVADGVEMTQLTVNVTDGCIVGDVTVNLSAIGGSDAQVMDFNGGDMYSTDTNASTDTSPGTYYLYVNASDVFGNYNDTSVYIELEVTAVGLTQTGDIDGDGDIDFDDAIYLASYILYGETYYPLYPCS